MDAPEREKKFGKLIPIIIENHTNGLKKTKLMVPSHYRASQLLNILRAKMKMSSVTSLYLFLKGKHRPLQASKCIGHLHQKYRNEKGCLHLIQADQSTFGFRGNIRAIRFRHKWMENLVSHGATQMNVEPTHVSPDPPVTSLLIDQSYLDDVFDFAIENMVNINNEVTDAESLDDELVLFNETVNNAFQPMQSHTAAPDTIIIPPIAPGPSVNTTTIQVLHDLSDIDGSFSTENDENATYIQTTTTIQYMEAFDINAISEYTPPLAFSTQSSTIDYQPSSELTAFLLPSSINPEQIVDPPNQPIEPATQQQVAAAQLQLPTTVQLMDPNSQEMNASVEWMQLGDQAVDGAGPTYGAMVFLEDEDAAPEEVFAFLPY